MDVQAQRSAEAGEAEQLPSAASPTRLDTILEAACRVIARDGAHALHMKAVAEEAGVSKALVHYYVATRQELLRQAVAHAERRTREQVEEELARFPTGRARLERMLLAYAGHDPLFAVTHGLWSASWGSLMLDDDLAPTVRSGYATWFAWVESLVAEGIADGSFPAGGDTHTVVTRLAALVEGLATLVETGVVGSDEAGHIVRTAVDEVARA